MFVFADVCLCYVCDVVVVVVVVVLNLKRKITNGVHPTTLLLCSKGRGWGLVRVRVFGGRVVRRE